MTENSTQHDENEFLTMADLMRMLWRHRFKIVLISLLAGAAMAAVAFIKPAGYESSTMLQIVPEYAPDGRVDRDLFETAILSHLEMAQSPIIASKVQRALDPSEELALLLDRVKIVRSPKTSLIKIAARAKTKEQALNTCRLWISELFAAVDQKNVEKALLFVRLRIKDLHDDWIKNMAAAADIKRRAELLQDQRLLTVERSVDGNILWRDLTAGMSSADASKMTNLFLKSQEVNSEYLDVQRQLILAEQSAASARAARDFYLASIAMLEARLKSGATAGLDKPAEQLSDARQFVESLVSARDILSVGEPVVAPARRGALKKIVLAMMGTFVFASGLAFLVEWFKQAHIS